MIRVGVREGLLWRSTGMEMDCQSEAWGGWVGFGAAHDAWVVARVCSLTSEWIEVRRAALFSFWLGLAFGEIKALFPWRRVSRSP